MTSLGTWDTIEGTKGSHTITYPLALLRQVLIDAGMREDFIDVYEGKKRPSGPWAVVAMGALDSRHFWKIPEYLRLLEIPVWSQDRNEDHPLVIVGGQSCYAPGPILPFADVVYVGEAEVSAAAMTRIATGHGSRADRLSRISKLPGCWVPSVHGYDHEIEAVYAHDAALSIRTAEQANVNVRRLFRVEIARGCPHRCPFCCLGWRQPYRPMPASSIIPALERYAATGKKEIHLQAGDAEIHPEIEQIRAAVNRLGLWDHSWTGRLDTVRTEHALPGKMFAFGIEGLSCRLREKAGKRGFTNEYVAGRIGELWRAGARRITLHMIGGLPGETEADIDDFEQLMWMLEDEAQASGKRQVISIGRQPFGPLPHTPWQREAPGLEHRRVGDVIQKYVGGRILSVVDREGQRNLPAIYAAIPMRSGPEIAPVLAAGQPRVRARMAIADLVKVLARHGIDGTRPWRTWGPDELLPWRGVKVRVR